MLIDTDDIVYNIELNKRFKKEVLLRNYIYQCNYLASMIKVRKKYIENIKPVIQINYNITSDDKINYNGNYYDIENKTG